MKIASRSLITAYDMGFMRPSDRKKRAVSIITVRDGPIEYTFAEFDGTFEADDLRAVISAMAEHELDFSRVP